LILLLALVGYGINRQNAFIFLHGFLQINVMHLIYKLCMRNRVMH